MADSSPAAPVPGDRRSVPATPAAAVPEFPALLFGRYRVRSELGRGGMGVVLLATDEELGQLVAVKLIPDMVVRDTEAIADLKKEVLRGMALQHPNIVRTHHFERDATAAAIIMEYVEGLTLAELKIQQTDACFGPSDVLPWLEQLCPMLDYAHHQARIAHRDLKPRNIMLSPEGRLKVADFGISSQLSDSLTRLSASGKFSGTPPYMSPQQAMGGRPSHLDDLYSLGATIYELLTSKPPFFRGQILSQVLNVPAPAMTARLREFDLVERAALPLAWERTVAACLSKDPNERPQSAGEVLARLKDGGTPQSFPGTPARPGGSSSAESEDFSYRPRALQAPTVKPATPEPVLLNAEPHSRGAGHWIWLAAGLVILALGAGFSAGRWKKAEAPPPSPAATPAIAVATPAPADLIRPLHEVPEPPAQPTSVPAPAAIPTPPPAIAALAQPEHDSSFADAVKDGRFAGAWSGTRDTKITMRFAFAVAGGLVRTQQGATSQPVSIEVSPDLASVYWRQGSGIMKWEPASYQNAPPNLDVEKDKASTQKLEPADKVLGPFKPNVTEKTLSFEVSDPGETHPDGHLFIDLTPAPDGQTAQCHYRHSIRFFASGAENSVDEEGTFPLSKSSPGQNRVIEPAAATTPKPAWYARAFGQRDGQPEPAAAATPNPATPAPTPTVGPTELRAFCERIQQDEQSQDLSRILANYDTRVDFTNLGHVGQAAIRADKAKYFQRWPQTTYQLKTDPEILETHSDRWKVRFQIDFSATNPAGERVTGVAEQTLDIVHRNGALKIAAEKGQVLSREKSTVPPAAGLPAGASPPPAIARQFDGRGTVYKIPDLKNLVGKPLKNSWLYGDFDFQSSQGNVAFFVTANIVGAVGKGSTVVAMESPAQVTMRPETIAGRQQYFNQVGIWPEVVVRITPNDPIELLSVARDARGRLIVRTRSPKPIQL